MKYGIINNSGEVIVELIYDEISKFSEGLAAVKLNGLWGYINTLGELVIPLQYNFADSFHEGLAKVTNITDLTGYINYLGEYVIHCQFYFGTKFNEGMAFVSHPIDGFIFINKRGQKQISTGEKQCLIEFHNGLAIISGKNGWSLINTNGSILFNRPNTFINRFSEGLAVFGSFKN